MVFQLLRVFGIFLGFYKHKFRVNVTQLEYIAGTLTQHARGDLEIFRCGFCRDGRDVHMNLT